MEEKQQVKEKDRTMLRKKEMRRKRRRKMDRNMKPNIKTDNTRGTRSR